MCVFTAMTRPPCRRFRQTGAVSSASGLDELADRLYSLRPADFVGARDEAVQAARDVGDRSGAAAIAKLRRPTVAAWLVNLLALRRADQLGELFALGAEMRAAQQDLRGPALRELASRRRAAVGALVSAACTLAGAARSTLPVAEVEATLVAALADEGLAEAVRAGRLLKSGHYDGFGETARPELQLISGAGDDLIEDGADDPVDAGVPGPVARTPAKRSTSAREAPAKRSAPGGQAAAERSVPNTKAPAKRAIAAAARQRLVEAAAARNDAETAYDAAVEALETRTREVADIEERLTRLRRDRVAAHAALVEAQATQDSMDAVRHAARRSFAAAERAAKRDDR
jgi:hypothetical protein